MEYILCLPKKVNILYLFLRWRYSECEFFKVNEFTSGTATLLFQNVAIFPQSQRGSAFIGKNLLLQKLIFLSKSKQHFCRDLFPKETSRELFLCFFSC